jgi:hypothetical protein
MSFGPDSKFYRIETDRSVGTQHWIVFVEELECPHCHARTAEAFRISLDLSKCETINDIMQQCRNVKDELARIQAGGARKEGES